VFYWVLGFIWFFGFSYLNEQLGSLLVDLAHQLSFYLDSPLTSTLDYPKIHKLITYLLAVRNYKHKEIFNYYWRAKVVRVFCCVNSFYPK